MFFDFVIGRKKARKARVTEADQEANETNYSVELLSDPVDKFRPDASAMFRKLKNVETLPEIKAMRRMRVQTDVGLEFDSSQAQESSPRVVSKILRSLAFWKNS